MKEGKSKPGSYPIYYVHLMITLYCGITGFKLNVISSHVMRSNVINVREIYTPVTFLLTRLHLFSYW